MSDPQTDLTNVVSEGGIAARHPPTPEITALVGSATGSEQNTVRAGIIPVACWRLEDVRFEFDSSFVVPGIEVELKNLAQLVKDHPPTSKSEGKAGFPLSVFGHADPTGNDDYNKQLSGRRATAIYALLTRDTNLWEKLFSQPLGNDKWGRKSLETMLDTVSPAPERKINEEKATQHEHNAGQRKELFGQYMEKLCGLELKLKKEDFLGHGDDAGGKGDFQGCSEFNPVLIFSQKDQIKFEQAKDKTKRNTENATNRRVVVLIFRKGSRVNPSKWPCPRANEGVAGCKKRFWSDGEKRRSTRLPTKRRQFKEVKDTFACRFYHRLLSDSPCEKTIASITIRLFDLRGEVMPIVEFFAELNRRQERGRADANGEFVLRDVELPNTCLVRWSRRTTPALPVQTVQLADLPPDLLGESEKVRPPEEQPVNRDHDFDFETVLNLEIPETSSGAGSDDDAIVRRLHNLGYPQHAGFRCAIELFNRDIGGGTEREVAARDSLESEVVRRHDDLVPPRKG